MRSRALAWLPLLAVVLPSCARTSSLDEVADFSPRFSPDGERIVFASDRGGQQEQIFEVVLESGEISQLTTLPGTAADPTYDIDGRTVIFVYRPPGVNGYQLGSIANGEVEFILGPEYRVAFPDVRRDGTIVAACVVPSTLDSTFGICVVERGEAVPTIVFDDPTARDWEPVWSPDGTEIALVSDRDGDDEILVMDSDGSNVRQLTSNAEDDTDPAWAPDGSKIAFDRGETDVSIWVMDGDGSGARRIVEGIRPAWSPDGESLAFYRSFVGDSSLGAAVAIAPLDGSATTFVTQVQEEPGSESPPWPVWVIVGVAAVGFALYRITRKPRTSSLVPPAE